MISFAKLLNLEYWLELRPYTEPGTVKVMAACFLAVLLLGVGAKIWALYGKKLQKFQIKLLNKYYVLLTLMGAWGLIIAAMRIERIGLFASRFWQIVWLIVFIIGLYPIIKYQTKMIPEAKKRAEEHKAFIKYLPKKK